MSVAQLFSCIETGLEESRRVDTVERELFAILLKLGLEFLKLFVSKSGDGDLGESVETAHGVLKRSEHKKNKRYQSVFGEVDVLRFVYSEREKQKAILMPLDQKLGLPANDQSYVLEDWLQRFVVKETYHEAVTSLETLLNIKSSVRSAERMARDLARHSLGFRPDESSDLPEDDEILVVTADGKGVPMRESLNQRKHEKYGTKLYESQNTTGTVKTTKRRTVGVNKSTKQMAYVGAVYSIQPFIRDVQDVIDELHREARQTDRPRPTNKLLSVEMTQVLDELQEGPQQLFRALQSEVESRIGSRTLVCLMDGQKSLWFNQRKYFPHAVPVLDLLHVMEYLWDAAYCFEPKGSAAAEKFVSKYLEQLLRGEVKKVIATFKRKRKSLKKSKLKTLEKVIGYYSVNASHMKYDEYLARGFPIGSGVIEGACRHLVKDRMERSGMRWTIEGATAVLKLRAVYVNGAWDQLVEHRIKTEQNALYAAAA